LHRERKKGIMKKVLAGKDRCSGKQKQYENLPQLRKKDETMFLALERRKCGKKWKQEPVIKYK